MVDTTVIAITVPIVTGGLGAVVALIKIYFDSKTAQLKASNIDLEMGGIPTNSLYKPPEPPNDDDREEVTEEEEETTTEIKGQAVYEYLDRMSPKNRGFNSSLMNSKANLQHSVNGLMNSNGTIIQSVNSIENLSDSTLLKAVHSEGDIPLDSSHENHNINATLANLAVPDGNSIIVKVVKRSSHTVRPHSPISDLSASDTPSSPHNKSAPSSPKPPNKLTHSVPLLSPNTARKLKTIEKDNILSLPTSIDETSEIDLNGKVEIGLNGKQTTNED